MTASRKPLESTPPRMEPLARLPIFMALDGRRALVAGGSPAAARKVELISAAGATTDVYASEASDELLLNALDPPRGPVTLHRRAWTSDDLRGVAIAVGDFDDDTPAVAIARATRPDQQVIAAAIADLSDRLMRMAPEGPVLVMIGRVCSAMEFTSNGRAAIAAR